MSARIWKREGRVLANEIQQSPDAARIRTIRGEAKGARAKGTGPLKVYHGKPSVWFSGWETAEAEKHMDLSPFLPPIMNASIYSPEVLQVLHSGGWFEGRHVPIDVAIQQLRSQGFTVSPAAEEVLHQFYPLDFEPSPTICGAEGITFDPGLAWIAGIDCLKRVVDEECCYIATKGVGDFFITPSGRIAMVDMDWTFIQIARDLAECFEALFCAKHSILTTIWLTDDQIPNKISRIPPK